MTNTDNMKPVIASMNTLKASKWTMFWVRRFGKRRYYEEDGYGITIRRWMGKSYLVEYFELPPQVFNCRCVIIPVDKRTEHLPKVDL